MFCCYKHLTKHNIDIFIEDLVVPIIATDSIGTIKHINESACRLFGYRYDELVNNNIKVLMPEEIATHHDKYMENYFAKYHFLRSSRIVGSGRNLTGLCKNGGSLDIHLSVSIMKISNNKITKNVKNVKNENGILLVSIIQDISKLLKNKKGCPINYLN